MTEVPSLAQHRWPVLDGSRPLLLVPVGSTEQHGPALPLGADTMIATSVTQEVARRLVDDGRHVLVAPAVGYGASGEHEGFPGTISIGREALGLMLVELGRSACRWAGDLVFVNGHGGNALPVRTAVELLRGEGRPVSWTDCSVPGADAHAGLTETSSAPVPRTLDGARRPAGAGHDHPDPGADAGPARGRGARGVPQRRARRPDRGQRR